MLRADALELWELGIKVDALDADDVELVVDDGGAQLVSGELEAEEMSGGGQRRHGLEETEYFFCGEETRRR